MNQRILIAGAGDLGVRVGALLAAGGAQIFALRRSQGMLPQSLEFIGADLRDPDSLSRLPERLDGVVYAAAADESSDAAYQQAYVLGLSNLLQAPSLKAHTPGRMLFVSSTAVYAQADGEWVDEASPCNASHFSGRRTLEAERVLSVSGVPWTVARAGGIYGPGRTRLIDQVRSGEARYDPDQIEYTNRIHVDDLAGAIVHLLRHPQGLGVFNCVDHEPAPRQEVLTWLAGQLAAPTPRALHSLAPSPEVSNPAPSTRSRVRQSNKRVSGEKLRALGYQFRYPSYREGYRELMLAAGLLTTDR
jgi:nucleoside-diphosphate-sugar epimerase